LYQDLPSDCIAKLEVYTFGNAAIHFNNPLRRLGPTAHISANGPTSSASIFSPISPLDGNAETNGLVDTPTSATAPSGPLSSASTPESLRLIPYIEHYCNSNDMVTRWGVLHSVKDILHNRFCGQVFVSEDTNGHMLNQHYLSKMFPISQPTVNGNGKGKASNTVSFLDSILEIDIATTKKHTEETKKQLGILRVDSLPHDAKIDAASPTGIARAATARRKATLELEMGNEQVIRDRDLTGEEATRLIVVRSGERLDVNAHGKTVRELSRLWRYMGGGTPE